MRHFVKALTEINLTLSYLMLFEVFLNSIVVFLISYLILLLLGIKPLHAFEVMIFYFGVNLYLKLRKRKILEIERKYSLLNEKLRTAEDNIYFQSPVVDDLQKEVIQDLRVVESSAFFNQKNLLIKLAVIVVLCFLVLNVKPIPFDSIKITLPEIKPAVSFDFTGTTRFVGTRFVTSKKGQQTTVQLVELSDNIYGDATVAILGGEELIIQLRGIQEELTVRDQEDLEEEQEELFPEIGTRSAEAFKENIPKEQQELVKNYFKSVVEG
jgi:hypothetical protein